MNPSIRKFVQGSIRAEKARRNLTHGDLSELLVNLGIRQSATNLSTKLSRGTLSAQLYLALLVVMDVDKLDLKEIDFRVEKKK